MFILIIFLYHQVVETNLACNFRSWDDSTNSIYLKVTDDDVTRSTSLNKAIKQKSMTTTHQTETSKSTTTKRILFVCKDLRSTNIRHKETSREREERKGERLYLFVFITNEYNRIFVSLCVCVCFVVVSKECFIQKLFELHS